MKSSQDEYLDVELLRVGHFVFVDVGWMTHPFPLSSFRIQSSTQIDTIRSLGIKQIRYSSAASDPGLGINDLAPEAAVHRSLETLTTEEPAVAQRRHLLSQQRASLQLCECRNGSF